jgi:hypothetical protein
MIDCSKFANYRLNAAKPFNPAVHLSKAITCWLLGIPPVPQVPNRQTDQMAESNATNVTFCRFDQPLTQERKIVRQNLRQLGWSVREPASRESPRGTTYKHGVNDG